MMMDQPPAIYHHVAGEGEAVVLLNGGMMSWFAWEPIAKPLAAEYRVVRLDFRGQLQSPLVPGQAPPADLSSHAQDVVELLDRLGIPKAHVVGTSFGALVGLAMAAEFPDRVASLVVMTATATLSPEMLAGTRALREIAQAAVAGGDRGKILDAIVPTTYSPEWVAANRELLAVRRGQVAMLPNSWFEGVDAILAVLLTAQPATYLERIRAPTTVVAGEKDVTFPLPNSEALVHGIRSARLVVVPGAPHGLVLEKPAETLELLRAALSSARAPASAGAVPR